MSQYMNLIGKNARKASLERVDTKVKNKILKKYLFLIDKEKSSIFNANAKDINFALKKKLKANLIDRLILDQKKLDNIKSSIKKNY